MTLFSSFSSATLSEAQKEKVNEAVNEVGVKRSMSVLEFVGSLRSEFISKDASVREMAINELSAVVLQLPEEVVTPEVSNFLLEFLLPRVEDSGHVAAEFLIAVIYFLMLRCGKKLSREVLAQAIGTLYETNGVQSYAQRDRMQLFELLHYLLDNFLEEIKTIFDSSKLVVSFMRAANSERDPRCLLKIFKLYNVIVHSFPLGNLTEDMFELIACYYPIDYEPNETDLGKISSEMLSIACESCLLAHESFASFCFQLISEKLLDDADASTGEDAEFRLKQQLNICNFLCKACETFGQSTSSTRELDSASRAELENFLTAFRLLALNPTQTRLTLLETRRCLSSTCAALAANFLRTRRDATKDLRFMAENTLEHCEPFVLQAEMGLTGKALIVLEAVASASQVSAEIVVSKVLYWFNVLLTGMTLKSTENKREICEETMEYLPSWFEMAHSIIFSGSTWEDGVLKVLADIFDAMDGTEEFCSRQKVLCAKFECARRGKLFLLYTRQSPLAEEGKNWRRCCQIVERLMSRVFEIGTDGDLSQSSSAGFVADVSLLTVVRKFVGEFSMGNFQQCRLLLEPSIRECTGLNDVEVSGREIEVLRRFQPPMFFILGAIIRTKESAEWISPILFEMALKTGENVEELIAPLEFYEAVLDTLERLSTTLVEREGESKGLSMRQETFEVFWVSFEKFVARKLDMVYLRKDNTDEHFRNFLQDVGIFLNESQHNAFVEFLLAKFADVEQTELKWRANFLRLISLPLLQSKSMKYVKRFVDMEEDVLSKYRNDIANNSTEDTSGTENSLKTILLHVFFAVFVNRKVGLVASCDQNEIASLLSGIYRQLCTCANSSGKSDARIDGADISDDCIGELGECGCEWRFRAEIARTRALLLTDSRRGISTLAKLFDFLLINSGSVNLDILSSELLDFWSRPINPAKCGLEAACTLMWKQRIFCQFVPIYVNYFGRITDENTVLKVAFLRLIESLFRAAKAIGQSMSRELRMIMPILTQTFSMIASQHSNGAKNNGMNIDLVLLLDSTLELLKATATIDELNGSGGVEGDERKSAENVVTPLAIFLRVFADILHNENAQNMGIVLKCLECLEVLAQKVAHEQRDASTTTSIATAKRQQIDAKDPLKAFHTRIVQGTIRLTKSRKRLIRQKAATVRNLWELL